MPLDYDGSFVKLLLKYPINKCFVILWINNRNAHPFLSLGTLPNPVLTCSYCGNICRGAMHCYTFYDKEYINICCKCSHKTSQRFPCELCMRREGRKK